MAKFSLLAMLGINTKGFQKGLDAADNRAKKFKKGLGGLKTALAGIGLSKAAMDAINLGSAISDMATQLNIGAEELQVLEFAAREAGVETGIMERAIRNVQLRTQQGIEGNKRYAEAYQTLGLNIAEVSRLPVEKKLEVIAKASAQATDQQAAYNAVAAILGERAGPKMQEILQSLAKDGFDNVSAAAKASGTVMDEDVIAKMDKAADKIEQVKRRFTVMVGTILTYAIPAFDILKNSLGFVGESFAVAGMNVFSFFKLLVKSVGTAISPAIKQMHALGLAARAALTINPLEKVRLFKEAAAKSREAFKDLVNVPSELKKNFDEAASDIKTNISGLGDDLTERAGAIKDAWGDAFNEVEKKSKKTGDVVAENLGPDVGVPSMLARQDGNQNGVVPKFLRRNKGAESNQNGASNFSEDTRGDFAGNLKNEALRIAAGVAGGEKFRFDRLANGDFQRFVDGKKSGKFSEEQLQKAVEGKIESKKTDSLLEDINKKLEGKFVNE